MDEFINDDQEFNASYNNDNQYDYNNDEMWRYKWQ